MKFRIVPKWLWSDRALSDSALRSILPVGSTCRSAQFLIFRNPLDSTPKSDVSSLTSRLDRRGVSRSSRNAGRDAVDAAALGVRWDRGADCTSVSETLTRKTTALVPPSIRLTRAGTKPVARLFRKAVRGRSSRVVLTPRRWRQVPRRRVRLNRAGQNLQSAGRRWQNSPIAGEITK
jgi:hypothetical protein